MGRFYDTVPRTIAENLDWRVKMRQRAARDKQLQRAIREACNEDILYFFGAWLWVFEPRASASSGRRVCPFIPWPHQAIVIEDADRTIQRVLESGQPMDFRCRKSRGEGWSWIGMGLAMRDWLFRPMTKIGLVSLNERMADSDDSDSLMWKLDFLVKELPLWMQPAGFDWNKHRSRTNHSLRNPENGSTVTGYAATGDVATGGRCAWFFMDELSKWMHGSDQDALNSTAPVSDCRLIGSSPKGDSGAFYDVIHEENVDMPLHTLHWADNPTRNQGLYTVKEGIVLAVDPVNNPLPDDYQKTHQGLLDRLLAKGYVLEGKLGSPWADRHRDRPRMTPRAWNQEYEIGFGGSVEKAFTETFAAIARKTCRIEMRRCRFIPHPEEGKWEIRDSLVGQLYLWLQLDGHGRVPSSHTYVIGADIAAGTGGSFSSNSVACVIDATSGAQVAELVGNTIGPIEFADMCYCLCLMFNHAHFIWEKNGSPGQTFTNHFLRYRYSNLYTMTVLKGRWKKQQKTGPGWNTPAHAKLNPQFEQLQQSVLIGELELRSAALVEECRQYEWMSVGGTSKIVHRGAVNTDAESAMGEAHGDRAVAAALAWHAIQEKQIKKMTEPVKEKDEDADFFAELERQAREKEDWVSGLDRDWVA